MVRSITRIFYIIGASLSEPHLDELAGAFLWYNYISVSMGSPFGPAWGPVNAQRAKVRNIYYTREMQSINGASLRVLDSSIERIVLKTFES